MKLYTRQIGWKKYVKGSISLCFIMKNEEKVLPRFLQYVKQIADEIVCVDTGSTDKSIQIVEQHGIKVNISPWQDDFAHARNAGLKLATKEWILILDPDEIVDPQDFGKLKQATNSKNFSAFRLTTKNYHNSPDDQSKKTIKNHDQFSKGFKYFTPSIKTRLFKNKQGIFFRGCYHELVDYDLNMKNIPVALGPVYIHHYNHEICQGNIEEKKALYCRLADKKIKQEPNNLHAWYEAGITFAISAQRRKALYCMIKSMGTGHAPHERLFIIARLYDFLKQPQLRRLAFAKGICKLFPELTHIDAGKRPLNTLIYPKNINPGL